MRLLALFIALAIPASVLAQQKSEPVRIDTGTDLLWKKLETRVAETADRMDGVMGVAILDLTDGRILLHNADRVFPTASSIKIAILLELYRQDQEAQSGAKGKAQLDDIYTFDPKTWSKIAGSWLVLLQVSHDLLIATWLNSCM